MISDPITVPNHIVTFQGSVPTGAAPSVGGKVVNTIEATGRKTSRRLNAAGCSALSILSATIGVSHETTNQGRRRSRFRVDAAKADSDGVPHSGSAYLVVDQVDAPTSEDTSAISVALAILMLCLFEHDGDTSIQTTSIASEFLNGEA